ncbi:LysR family transcriptional regulator [Microlunatus sp. Gsoil 973]|uniref:LysR family transcriptional regulator n=1 Tax=Microlunatus sp. Gsoil 973 TaxID=2672569 RepID=UPI0012B4ED72|nr:LysR family transcriptional regulator [Microlunatus sp. Gsoil 973]QGN34223.1 LysR family transcriptional regulator [Microlunatus sp. Gsoil 973]
MLDINRLRVFRAVVAEGSVVRAAGNLGYTPSAVSQHLSALQRETGLTLVERRGRGIVPTGVGRLLAAESEAVLERLARLEALTGDLRAGRVGSLLVSHFASAGSTWIPPIVAALTREFPTLRLDLRLTELLPETGDRPDVEIFVEGAASSPLDGYDIEPLLTEPYVAVVPADHPLAGAGAVALAGLRDEPWVDNDVARGACRRNLLRACAAAGFAPGFHIETQDYPTAIAFVAAGAGITVVPRLGLVSPPPGIAVLDLVDPTPTRSIMVRSRESLRENPAVRRLLGLLRERAAGEPPSAG